MLRSKLKRKISVVKIDPMLLGEKYLEPDCLPPVCSYLGHLFGVDPLVFYHFYP